MSDSPKLPESPMTALRQDEPDAFAGLWHERALRLGYALVVVFGVSTAADAILIRYATGAPVSGPDIEALSLVASTMGANLLLGLLALQIANRSGRVGRVAAIAARPAGALLAAAHVYWMVYMWGPVISAGVSASGAIASVLLIAIPVRRRSQIVRHATVAAALTSLGAPVFMCASIIAFGLSGPPDLWTWVLLVVAGLLPIIGCIALLRLIYTEPPDDQPAP